MYFKKYQKKLPKKVELYSLSKPEQQQQLPLFALNPQLFGANKQTLGMKGKTENVYEETMMLLLLLMMTKIIADDPKETLQECETALTSQY